MARRQSRQDRGEDLLPGREEDDQRAYHYKNFTMRVAVCRGPTRAQWTAKVNEGVNDVRHTMFEYAEAGVAQACMTWPGLKRLTPKQRAEFWGALCDIDPLYCG